MATRTNTIIVPGGALAVKGSIATTAVAVNGQDISVYYMAPSGIVSAFAGSNAPNGWLLCQGQAVSRTTYTSLFNVLSTTYGAGDGSTTFNLPDLRGTFVRGLDAGRNVDSGRAIGTAQSDAIQQIYGEFQVNNGFNDCISGSAYQSGVFGTAGSFSSTAASKSNVGNTAVTFNFSAARVVRTANETRPVNLAMQYIIKI